MFEYSGHYNSIPNDILMPLVNRTGSIPLCLLFSNIIHISLTEISNAVQLYQASAVHITFSQITSELMLWANSNNIMVFLMGILDGKPLL